MTMKDDQLDPQMKQLFNKVKLKEPKRAEMTDYLSKVRSKVDFKRNQAHFHFAPVGIALVLVAVLSGLIYWVVQNQPKEKAQISMVSKISEQVPKPVSTPNLSLEEEMAILEAFNEEYPNETNDLLGDEGALEDLVLMDEVEFTVTPGPSPGT